MSIRARITFLAFSLLLATNSKAAFNLNVLDASSLAGALPDDVAAEAVKTFGIYFAHRPYDGAVSMFNTNSLDFKVEVTLVKIGDGIFNALIANNLASTQSNSNSALPMAKIHLRKPLSPTADMGVSGIYYQGQYAIGTDLKFELDNPEEGINTALRIGYSYATAEAMYLDSVHAISPEFVISRKIETAEPYMGFGARYITGTVAVPFDIAGSQFTVTKTGVGYTAYAYTGVNFQILGPKGFRLGMEGHYDISGFSSIGTTFGIGF
jgi:hypothetical protein